MSRAVDPYKVLQVDPEADPEVIQAAYRRLAQKYHPDRAGQPGSPEAGEAERRMVALNAAWEVVGDPARRAEHDRIRAGRPETPGSDAPARPSTQVAFAPGQLTFGRYAGMRLEEILRVDPGYLEWLDRTPIGRPHRDEIDLLLRKVGKRSKGTEGSGGLPRR